MFYNITLFFVASFFEIFGCYTFWLYFRDTKSHYWLTIGVISLVIFAYVLTKIDVANASRVYAIYGGIYIVSSLLWLIYVEKEMFNRWDLIGATISLFGALIIYLGNKL